MKIGDSSTSVYSLTTAITQPCVGTSCGKPKLDPIEITADVGDIYPQLIQAASQNKLLDTVHLSFAIAATGSTLSIDLSKALIINISAGGNAPVVPRQTIDFVYSGITYSITDSSGAAKEVKWSSNPDQGGGNFSPSGYVVLVGGSMAQPPSGSIVYGFSNGIKVPWSWTDGQTGKNQMQQFVLTKQIDENTAAELSGALGYSLSSGFNVLLTKVDGQGVASAWLNYKLSQVFTNSVTLISDVNGVINEQVSYSPSALAWEYTNPDGSIVSGDFNPNKPN